MNTRVCTHTCTRVLARIHAHVLTPAHTHTHVLTHARACTLACVHAHVLTPAHAPCTRIHTCTHSRVLTHARVCTLAQVQAHVPTPAHTHTHTHTCTRARTHTLNTSPEKGCRPSLSNTNALTREDLIPCRDFMTPYGVALLSGSNPSSRAREGLSGVLTQGTERGLGVRPPGRERLPFPEGAAS